MRAASAPVLPLLGLFKALNILKILCQRGLAAMRIAAVLPPTNF